MTPCMSFSAKEAAVWWEVSSQFNEALRQGIKVPAAVYDATEMLSMMAESDRVREGATSLLRKSNKPQRRVQKVPAAENCACNVDNGVVCSLHRT